VPANDIPTPKSTSLPQWPVRGEDNPGLVRRQTGVRVGYRSEFGAQRAKGIVARPPDRHIGLVSDGHGCKDPSAAPQNATAEKD